MYSLNDKLTVICEQVKVRPYAIISCKEIPGFHTTVAEIICAENSPYVWCIFNQSFSLSKYESFQVKVKFLDKKRGLFLRVIGTASIEQEEVVISDDESSEQKQIKTLIKLEIDQVVRLAKKTGELVMYH
jgi:hypothetical protein